MSNRTDLQELVEAYLEDPTQARKDEAVIAGVPLVRSLIGRITVPDHPLTSAEDLENVGLLGLLQALEQYDPDRGTSFASYAYGRIRGAIVDYLRSIDVLPRRKRQLLAEAQSAIESLQQVLGHDPTDEDVANYLGIPLEKYHTLLRDAQRRFALSLHHESEQDGYVNLEVLSNPNARDVRKSVEFESSVDHLAELISQLPERQQKILTLYYYENLTLKEIGTVLDLSEARISQILGSVHLKLRSMIEESRKKTS